MALDVLMGIPKEEIPHAAEGLTEQQIGELVNVLNDKADAPRYQALLLLSARSEHFPDVYPYWPAFREKLKDANSYQRSIGILMLAENARWDAQGVFSGFLDDCLELIADEKPITARQSIQSLTRIAQALPETAPRIASRLMGMDLLAIRETMRKLILLDVCRTLASIRSRPDLRESIDAYLMTALSGDILDKAAKKELRTAMMT